MIGVKKEKEEWRAINEPAEYLFNPALIHALGLSDEPYRYENMFPLLLKNFSDARIIAVGTPESIDAQEALLAQRHPDIRHDFEKITLDDAHDYHDIFRKLGDLMMADEEIIVDISHSYRHLPALMMVDMIIANIKNPGRVHHILFAKELERFRRYRIIDLREYLTLANISYALASFTKNYTIATTVRTVDEIYQTLLNELSRFGDHILANSFEALLMPEGDKPSLVRQIIDNIELIKHHERTRDLIHPLVPSLDSISKHMKEVSRQAERPMDERLYFFARLMYDKGYLLNALTLVDEAAAAYCVEAFRKLPTISKSVKMFDAAIQNRDNPKLYNRYELTNIAKNIIKIGKFYKKNLYREDDATIMEQFIEATRDYINEHYWKLKNLRDFLFACDETRNNLAHANSDKRLDHVRLEIKNLLIRYEEVCYEEDPLKRFTN